MNIYLVSFREFIEAFVIVGLIFGYAKKKNFQQGANILKGAVGGFLISLALICSLYFLSSKVHIDTEDIFENFERFSMIVSGLLLIGIVYYHRLRIHKNMSEGSFQKSLLLPAFFLVLQEGFEIGLFTLSSAFNSSFWTNSMWLFMGFAAASLCAFIIYKSYLKSHVQKLLLFTEYIFLGYGAFLIIKGIMELII